MDTKTNEHLSAVFDDEAGAFESRRILDELTDRHDMQETWSHYALIGEAMKQSSKAVDKVPVQSGALFLSGLHERMLDEGVVAANTDTAQNHDVNKSQSSPVWLRPVAGVAATATIVAVAAFAFQDFGALSTQSSNEQLATVSEQRVDDKTDDFSEGSLETGVSGTVEAAQMERQRLAELQQQQRMQRYLASHIEYASRSTIAPTVRTVAYGY